MYRCLRYTVWVRQIGWHEPWRVHRDVETRADGILAAHEFCTINREYSAVVLGRGVIPDQNQPPPIPKGG